MSEGQQECPSQRSLYRGRISRGCPLYITFIVNLHIIMLNCYKQVLEHLMSLGWPNMIPSIKAGEEKAELGWEILGYPIVYMKHWICLLWNYYYLLDYDCTLKISGGWGSLAQRHQFRRPRSWLRKLCWISCWLIIPFLLGFEWVWFCWHFFVLIYMAWLGVVAQSSMVRDYLWIW